MSSQLKDNDHYTASSFFDFKPTCCNKLRYYCTVLTATVEVPTKVVFSSVSVEMTSLAAFNSFSLRLSRKASDYSTRMAGKRLVKKEALASATNGNTTSGKRI